MKVSELRNILENVDGDLDIVVRTDYYAEVATTVTIESREGWHGPDRVPEHFLYIEGGA